MLDGRFYVILTAVSKTKNPRYIGGGAFFLVRGVAISALLGLDPRINLEASRPIIPFVAGGAVNVIGAVTLMYGMVSSGRLCPERRDERRRIAMVS
jgi:hypothetical protein